LQSLELTTEIDALSSDVHSRTTKNNIEVVVTYSLIRNIKQLLKSMLIADVQNHKDELRQSLYNSVRLVKAYQKVIEIACANVNL